MTIRAEADNNNARFAALALPHLDAAYNLARWLTCDDHAAEDLVQMAYLRAFRFFDGFSGDDARAWLLTIVRNTHFTALRDNALAQSAVAFDEAAHSHGEDGIDISVFGSGNSPEANLLGMDASRAVNQALESLPVQFREVIVLKEMDELSYKQIAQIAGIPIGTVMSRLARGRKLLAACLQRHGFGG